MAAKETFTIYKFTSPNGKLYIGQTNWVEKRFAVHRSSKTKTYLSKAIQKYGFDNFIIEILKEGLTIEDANYWEALYIKEFNSLFPNGYNLRTGGDNSIPCEQSRLNMSSAQKARQPFPEAHRKAISISNTGRKRADSEREKLSAVHTGKKHSPEHCKNNGLAKKGIPQAPEHIQKRIAAVKATWERKRQLAATLQGSTHAL